MSHATGPDEIEAAAARLAAGELVAFPTETVYGLGADALSSTAVGRIYAAKGRPADHPVIVHLAPGADLGDWARVVPPQAERLVEAFWPGPLTLILPRAARVPDFVCGGQDSVGLRCPSHPVAQALLGAYARLREGAPAGIAAPSANRFGQVSPTRADHVRAEFAQEVAQGMPVLEGGDAEVGIESTILDLSRLAQVGPVLLRPGAITPEDIAAVIGVMPAAPDGQAPRASGTLKAHYAPRTPLRQVQGETLRAWASGQGDRPPGRLALVACAARLPASLAPQTDWVSAPDTPADYARRLYALLRELDTQGYDMLVFEAPPVTSAWAAVNDRLGRAAAAYGG